MSLIRSILKWLSEKKFISSVSFQPRNRKHLVYSAMHAGCGGWESLSRGWILVVAFSWSQPPFLPVKFKIRLYFPQHLGRQWITSGRYDKEGFICGDIPFLEKGTYNEQSSITIRSSSLLSPGRLECIAEWACSSSGHSNEHIEEDHCHILWLLRTELHMVAIRVIVTYNFNIHVK